MKVLGAGKATRSIEMRILKASFQAALVACLAGFGTFTAVLGMLAPDGGDEPAVPQDILLVGVNLLPLAAIAFLASSVGLFWGLRILHWIMAGLMACFVAGVAALWLRFADRQSFVDQAFVIALLLPGLGLLAGHWAYLAWKSRFSLGERS